MKFQQTAFDPCIYTSKIDDEQIYLAVYIDDLLIAAKSNETVTDTKLKFQEVFNAKDMGNCINFWEYASNKMKTISGLDKTAMLILYLKDFVCQKVDQHPLHWILAHYLK